MVLIMNCTAKLSRTKQLLFLSSCSATQSSRERMSVSAIFGTRLEVPLPLRGGGVVPVKQLPPPERVVFGGGCGSVVECSSRPQKKATKHHMKTRPRKSQPWDIRRGPTVYPPLPALPPEWTPVSGDAASPPQPAPSE